MYPPYEPDDRMGSRATQPELATCQTRSHRYPEQVRYEAAIRRAELERIQSTHGWTDRDAEMYQLYREIETEMV